MLFMNQPLIAQTVLEMIIFLIIQQLILKNQISHLFIGPNQAYIGIKMKKLVVSLSNMKEIFIQIKPKALLL